MGFSTVLGLFVGLGIGLYNDYFPTKRKEVRGGFSLRCMD